jgi:hypothetical protein
MHDKYKFQPSFQTNKKRFQRVRSYGCVQSMAFNLELVTCWCSLLTQLEVLGSLKAKLLLRLACLAFQTENNLTRSLGLLVENWLRLSTETHLLRVVSALSLSKVGGLTSFVLRHLMHGMLFAFAGAICFTFLWYIHHFSLQ